MGYKPPYDVTRSMLERLGIINRLIGRIEGYQLLRGNLRLRRINKIRSLHSSLAIEGNALSRDQVTAILDGKPVIGAAKDILEVQNALKVYDGLNSLDAYSEEALLATHGQLLAGLEPDAGRYRSGSVGVVDGNTVIHLAPPAARVPVLMQDLFAYLLNFDEDLIIKSCVFHYEFEFIHPFSDGNGRMGRLWQTAILKTRYPDLEYLPLESIIHDRQTEYYAALLQSQRAASSNPFIDFTLDALQQALEDQLATATAITGNYEDRLRAFREIIGDQFFTRKDYQLFHKQIATATATRDLRRGVAESLLTSEGKLRTMRYRFPK